MVNQPEKVMVQCIICHRSQDITTSDKDMYELPAVRENFVCIPCTPKVKRVRIVANCCKCSHSFQTKVLLENKDKYNDDWLCPLCASNALPQPKKSVYRKGLTEQDCGGCVAKYGVCCHTELPCSLSRNFAHFGNGDLSYLKRNDCTILSVHKVSADRADIHCFGYTVLYKPVYGIDPGNVVIIRQRIGSKKHFITSIIVYRYNPAAHKFVVAYNDKFDKGVDWIVPVRDFLLNSGAVQPVKEVIV